jgi:hypothetical protein
VNGSLGAPLPMVSPNARFNETLNSFDLRPSREFHLGERYRLQAFGEVFNLFNKTNIHGSEQRELLRILQRAGARKQQSESGLSLWPPTWRRWRRLRIRGAAGLPSGGQGRVLASACQSLRRHRNRPRAFGKTPSMK